MPLAAIIGIAVGGVVLLAIGVGGIVYWKKKQTRNAMMAAGGAGPEGDVKVTTTATSFSPYGAAPGPAPGGPGYYLPPGAAIPLSAPAAPYGAPPTALYGASPAPAAADYGFYGAPQAAPTAAPIPASDGFYAAAPAKVSMPAAAFAQPPAASMAALGRATLTQFYLSRGCPLFLSATLRSSAACLAATART